MLIEHLLAVSGDAPDLQRLGDWLSERNYLVDRSGDAREAVRLLHTKRYDLIYLDLGDEGFGDCFREALKGGTRVVVLHGGASTEQLIECFRMGAADCLAKPIDVSELEAVTRRALGADQARAEQAAQQLEALCVEVQVLLQQDETDRCAELIRQAMCCHPGAAQPHNLMGILLERRGDGLNALKHYHAALALDPSYRPADRNLDRLVMLDRPDTKRAYDFG